MSKNSGGILVVCDYGNGFSDHMKQMISKAHQLSEESGHEVCVLFINSTEAIDIAEFAKYGTDVLYYGTADKLKNWDYCDLAQKIMAMDNPQLVLFQATEFGKTIAATLSSRLEIGLTADCIDIVYDDKKGYIFSRAAMSDSVVAQIIGINCGTNMGTIKEGGFKTNKVTPVQDMAVQPVVPNDKHWDIEEECLESSYLPSNNEEVNINHFSTVFCVGRGASSPECLNGINKLAEKYNAGVIATRPIVEEGLIDSSRQVGQSGKSISPKLYVSFGVSGASQHLVGMKNSDIIIAVNNDPSAPIFDYANYAVVADAYDVIQELNNLLPGTALL